jgi:hypothetical protein
MLGAFWSWAYGIISVVLLGLLLPATLGAISGLVPLMRSRRDWRNVPSLLLVAVLFAASGAWSLAWVRSGAPAADFWGMLSFQLALISFTFSFVLVLRASIKRARRDRDSLQALRAFVPEDRAMAEGQRPGPRVSLRAIEAEYYVAEWMRWLGAIDAEVTRARRDGGVDVRSAYYVAQVKHRPQDFVSVDVVRALHGVASTEQRTGLVFSSGRYSSAALAFASRAGVALFIFRPVEGRLVAANAMAQQLNHDGLRAGVPQPV